MSKKKKGAGGGGVGKSPTKRGGTTPPSEPPASRNVPDAERGTAPPAPPGLAPLARPGVRRAIVLALLAIHFALAYSAATTKSLTSDEIAHLPAGIAYLKFRDDRLNPEHPPLAKVWAALPALFMDVEWNENDPDWLAADDWIGLARAPAGIRAGSEAIEASVKAEWDVGRRALYEWNRDRLDAIVARMRIMLILVSLAAGLLLHAWATAAFGPLAGLAALALHAFCPTILGHAPVDHNDVAVMATNLWFLRALYAVLEPDRPRPTLSGRRRAIAIANLGAAIAATLLSKHSQLAVFIFGAIAGTWVLVRTPPPDRAGRTLRLLADALLALAVCAVCMELFYRVVFGASFHPRWWIGMSIVRARLAYQQFGAFYLLGEVRGRFLSYFAVALAVKLTLPALASLASYPLAWIAGAPATRSPVATYLALYVAFFFAFLTFQFPNMGVRHALPLIAPAFLLAGAGLAEIARSRPGRAVAIALLATHALVAIRAWPGYIAYMNAFTVPRGKFHWLADSNLDWGQDLKALGDRLRANPPERLLTRFYVASDPGYYGVNGTPVREESDIVNAPPGTLLAVSAAFLQGNAKLLEYLESRWRREAVVEDTIYLYRFDG